MHDALETDDFLSRERWILYIFISMAIAFIMSSIHESGHVIANTLSGVPGGMSYNRSYSINGEAGTVIGALGGSIITVILAYIGVLLIYKKRLLLLVYPFSLIMSLDRIYLYLFCYSADIKLIIGNKGLPGTEERFAAEMLKINPHTFFILFHALELIAVILIILSLRFSLKKNLFIMLMPTISSVLRFGISAQTLRPILLSVAVISILSALILFELHFLKGKAIKKTGVLLISVAVSLVILAGAFSVLNQALDKAAYNNNFEKPSGYSPEIEPYVNFLKTATPTNPVDYVMNLFDKYDIVVLCERDHRDITQYELFYDIISDERFIEKSGCVFTEIGTQTINDRLNKFLQTSGLKKKEIDKQLIGLYRDLYRTPYWEKYNLYDFFKKVYCLNNTLPDSEKVSINCSDMPIDWNNMTKEKYSRQITERLVSRDKIMADFITAQYKKIEKSSSNKKKILVIMNYWHAFKLFNGKTADYLNKELPGKVANIMINSLMILPGSNDHNDIREPVQNGKWDAAFRYFGNAGIGFNFSGTPFGKDHFDYCDIQHQYTYQDVFNGFIFYRPLEEHLIVANIPGFVDEEFYPTFIERLKIVDASIVNDPSGASYNSLKESCNIKREEHYPDILKYNAEIEKWLE